MVVQGIIALALALPTGMLFGVGYGTGVRIGYEQVYPLLFPQDSENRNVTPTVENIKRLNQIYDTIGGKEASQMGIAKGLNDAMSQLNNNPDFQDLVELESKLSGRTPSNLDLHNQSEQTPTSVSESDSSLSDFTDDQGNFSTVAEDPDLYIHILKEQGNNAQTETNYNERKVKLRILIQKMSARQIKDAYSDMLSGRLQPAWAQNDSQFKQILTVEYKMTLAGTNQIKEPITNIDAPDIPTPARTEGNIVQGEYFTKKVALLKSIWEYTQLITARKKQLGTKWSSDATLRIWIAQLPKQQKLLINHITKYRNIGHTKARANNDWNKRIWLHPETGLKIAFA